MKKSVAFNSVSGAFLAAFHLVTSFVICSQLDAADKAGGRPAGQITYKWTLFAGKAGEKGSADGTSSEARFNGPAGIAVDALGNLFVADCHNNAIRKITAKGEVSTFVGSGNQSGTQDGDRKTARLFHPVGLTIDGRGNLFVAEFVSSTIRKITPEGDVSTIAGNGDKSAYGSADGRGREARFFFPTGTAVDKAGNVYVGDTKNEIVRKITPEGVVSTLAGKAEQWGYKDGIGSEARLSGPGGMVVGPDGVLYVADVGNCCIRKISPDGKVTTFVGRGGEPGEFSGRVDAVGDAARFDCPDDLVMDAAGIIYVADTENHTIRRVFADGRVDTIGGKSGQPGALDSLGGNLHFRPRGIAISADGILYVTDQFNHIIYRGVPE
ncbi:MAG: NHL repeat-containing protein [Prosthecobacter sp.]|uniref:NHL repeat-containing protein n=1 Tax=Prosthecobacter sp. TaxID=1965333 RepID=UPI003BB05E6A